MLQARDEFEPNVPVPDPAPVPPELDAGKTPEIVPRSWGVATAADQSPAGPTEATFASAVMNTVELGVH